MFGDSGYTGVDKRSELSSCKAMFFIAAKRSQVRAIGNARERKQVERWESWKASMRAKVEHPFRAIKRQFGYTKALPRLGQEHGTVADILCAVQSVDGAPAVAAGIGINPSAGACRHHRNGEKPHIWRACRS